MAVPSTHPQKRTAALIKREERKARVLQALLAGLPLLKVAEQVGAAYDTVRRDAFAIQTEWREQRLASADEYIDRECQRLDALLAAHWANALAGDEASSKIVLRITDQRARLLGLNAEHRVKLTADIQVQVTESPEFMQLAQVVMAALADQPQARSLVAAKLRELAPAHVIEGTVVEPGGQSGE